MTTIFQSYMDKREAIEATQEQVKVLQGESRAILQDILETHGKGPHDFPGGKRARVVKRGDILVLFPERKGAPRKKKAAAASSEGASAAPTKKKASKKAAAKRAAPPPAPEPEDDSTIDDEVEALLS